MSGYDEGEWVVTGKSKRQQEKDRKRRATKAAEREDTARQVALNETHTDTLYRKILAENNIKVTPYQPLTGNSRRTAQKLMKDLGSGSVAKAQKVAAEKAKKTAASKKRKQKKTKNYAKVVERTPLAGLIETLDVDAIFDEVYSKYESVFSRLTGLARGLEAHVGKGDIPAFSEESLNLVYPVVQDLSELLMGEDPREVAEVLPSLYVGACEEVEAVVSSVSRAIITADVASNAKAWSHKNRAASARSLVLGIRSAKSSGLGWALVVFALAFGDVAIINDNDFRIFRTASHGSSPLSITMDSKVDSEPNFVFPVASILAIAATDMAISNQNSESAGSMFESLGINIALDPIMWLCAAVPEGPKVGFEISSLQDMATNAMDEKFTGFSPAVASSLHSLRIGAIPEKILSVAPEPLVNTLLDVAEVVAADREGIVLVQGIHFLNSNNSNVAEKALAGVVDELTQEGNAEASAEILSAMWSHWGPQVIQALEAFSSAGGVTKERCSELAESVVLGVDVSPADSHLQITNSFCVPEPTEATDAAEAIVARGALEYLCEHGECSAATKASLAADRAAKKESTTRAEAEAVSETSKSCGSSLGSKMAWLVVKMAVVAVLFSLTECWGVLPPFPTAEISPIFASIPAPPAPPVTLTELIPMIAYSAIARGATNWGATISNAGQYLEKETIALCVALPQVGLTPTIVSAIASDYFETAKAAAAPVVEGIWGSVSELVSPHLGPVLESLPPIVEEYFELTKAALASLWFLAPHLLTAAGHWAGYVFALVLMTISNTFANITKW